MRVIAIIQARMTSSRLPGKVMADVVGQPLLKRMLDRIRRSEVLDGLWVATTTNDSDDPIVDLCISEGIEFFRGSETDVLGRFLLAAQAANADVVVRMTADCPLVDSEVIDDCVRLFKTGDWDYVSNVGRRTYPNGMDVEVFSIDVLRRTSREAKLPQLREHVTPYMRGNIPGLPNGGFRSTTLEFKADFSKVRFTVDYLEDLERVRSIFAELVEPFGWLDALSVVIKRPDLLKLDS